MRTLHGRVALVTGGARRLGKAINLELARAGCDLLLHYGNTPAKQVAETLAEIRGFGVQAKALQANLVDITTCYSLLQAVEAQFGRLDYLVNNAANFQRRDLLAVTREDWDETLAINLSAPFFLTQAVAPLLRRGGGGAIINIGDYGSLQPWPRYPHHGMSKAALLMLTRTSALSLAPQIRVNAILPGPILKPENMSEQNWQDILASTPLGNGGSAAVVARALRFLLEEPTITGAALTVDGGHSLLGPQMP